MYKVYVKLMFGLGSHSQDSSMDMHIFQTPKRIKTVLVPSISDKGYSTCLKMKKLSSREFTGERSSCSVSLVGFASSIISFRRMNLSGSPKGMAPRLQDSRQEPPNLFFLTEMTTPLLLCPFLPSYNTGATWAGCAPKIP
jgi:hypothetical protein